MKIPLLFFLLLISFHSFCQYDNIKPQGIYSSSFHIDEKPRSITYYMPASFGRQEAYPLLIVIPADRSDAASVIKKYGDIIQAKADSAGCIVLYPDAYNGHWNSDSKDTVNDAGFISIMAEFFLRQFDCDLGQIRLAGIGNGGNLCYRIGCQMIYKPVAISTINASVNKSNLTGCRNNPDSIPSLNITSAMVAKADIAHALAYIFSYGETKR